MSFLKHESCRGITLWKWGQYKIELWRCPALYSIKPHSHNDQDIELAFVRGQATFFRKIFTKADGKLFPVIESRDVSGWGSLTRKFSVPAGTVHWFSVSTKPLWFLNFARYKAGVKVTSASIDFHLAET